MSISVAMREWRMCPCTDFGSASAFIIQVAHDVGNEEPRRAAQEIGHVECLGIKFWVPHIVQAYQNATAVTTMAEESAAAKKALEHFGRAVIVLTRDGRVKLMSTAADQLFTKYFGSKRSGGLPDCIQGWMEH